MSLSARIEVRSWGAAGRTAVRWGVFLRHAAALSLLFVVLSVVYWAGVWLVAGSPGMPLDDSYIHLQYARSIVEGHPFEYTRGIRSSGSSAPGWSVLVAGCYLIARNWLAASYLAGVIFTAACTTLMYALVLRWTGSDKWAFWSAVLLLLTNPTIISAYCGMEVSAYVAAFLGGLLAYDLSRTAAGRKALVWRLMGSAVFALGVWLRPEFLLMPVIILIERFVCYARSRSGERGRFVAEMSLHAVVWMLLLVPYLAFNRWASGEWLPNTFAVKALARNSSREVQLLAGLPAAWVHRDWHAALRCFLLWEPMMIISVVLGLLINNAVLTWRLPAALRDAWKAAAGPAGVIAAVSLVAFPLARCLVDPIGLLPFQFQRYFGQITPLMILLPIAFWAGREGAARLSSLRFRAAVVFASLFGFAFHGAIAAIAVENINDMQVYIGKWLARYTPPDALIATNDVGAIAFYSNRPVLDTVGLTEPDLARHYLAGGTLEEYLRRLRPQYACLFSKWHDGIARNKDLFEIMFKVRLKFNVICGARSMWVLRTRWDPHFGEGRIDPNNPPAYMLKEACGSRREMLRRQG